MPANPLSVRAFRDAEATFEHDLLRLLDRHRAALGGQLGVVHALLETSGALCNGLLTDLGASPEGEVARRHLHQQITALALYVGTVRSTPQ